MIEVLPESGGLVVGLRLQGELGRAEYRDVLVPRITEAVKAHGRYRALLILEDDFSGFEAGAAVEDPDFGLKHRAYLLERLALVCSSPRGAVARLVGHLASEQVRVFAPGDVSAWEWVREHQERPHATLSAQDLLGATVQDRVGGELGVIDDLVFDLATGSIRLLVVRAAERAYTLPYHAVHLREDGSALLVLRDVDASHEPLAHAPAGRWRRDLHTFQFETHPGLGGLNL
ncbi:MAG: PRC-barrel domain-containing protein [Planctomycetota bacterium]